MYRILLRFDGPRDVRIVLTSLLYGYGHTDLTASIACLDSICLRFVVLVEQDDEALSVYVPRGGRSSIQCSRCLVQLQVTGSGKIELCYSASTSVAREKGGRYKHMATHEHDICYETANKRSWVKGIKFPRLKPIYVPPSS